MEKDRMRSDLMDRIKRVNPVSFKELALDIFAYQKNNCLVYKQFLDILGQRDKIPVDLSQIPLLPISTFKYNEVKCGDFISSVIYRSSTTSGNIQSLHHVRDENWYFETARKIFTEQYGPLQAYDIFALLPSYLERKGSSLIAMVDHFMKVSNSPNSGFFLYNHASLLEAVARPTLRKKLLIGVSFALVDLAEKIDNHFPLMDIIMETGGMKGRRKELSRSELHKILQNAFGPSMIHSEYGMTELLSQAYSEGLGVFTIPSSMQVSIKELTDPMTEAPMGQGGQLGIIDLANIDSCAFLLTDDMGRKIDEHSFEVLGRIDHSDVRGCNLMVSDL